MMIAATSTALAVAGCSDSAKHDLAACKLKAIEIYNLHVSSSENEDSAAYYVQICMAVRVSVENGFLRGHYGPLELQFLLLLGQLVGPVT